MPASGIRRTEKSNAPKADPSKSELYSFDALIVGCSFKIAEPSENCVPVITEMISVRIINIECKMIAGIIILFNRMITSGRRQV
jgi:hypothetical protein